MAGSSKKFTDIAKLVKADDFLKNQVMIYGDGEGIEKCPRISFGIYSLDKIFDGGFPKGRICEFFGPESGGKTTLALHAIAAAQRAGGVCCFIDAENAFDPWYAKQLGVKVDEIMLIQPDSGEAAFDCCNKMIEYGVDLTVVDSVASLIPQEELEKELTEKEKMGVMGKMMSRGMRKLIGTYNKLKNKDASVIFINQVRDAIGVMYGNPETTPGGRALKFYSSVRVDIRRLSEKKEIDVKGQKEIIAKISRIKIVKSKVCRPFVQTDLWLDCSANPVGFRKDFDIMDNAVKEQVINNIAWDPKTKEEKTGRKYFFTRKDGERIFVAVSQADLENKLNTCAKFFEDVRDVMLSGEEYEPSEKTKYEPLTFESVYGGVAPVKTEGDELTEKIEEKVQRKAKTKVDFDKENGVTKENEDEIPKE